LGRNKAISVSEKIIIEDMIEKIHLLNMFSAVPKSAATIRKKENIPKINTITDDSRALKRLAGFIKIAEEKARKTVTTIQATINNPARISSPQPLEPLQRPE
jgi:ABC-type metal ion transport system substrate-binding protein